MYQISCYFECDIQIQRVIISGKAPFQLNSHLLEEHYTTWALVYFGDLYLLGTNIYIMSHVLVRKYSAKENVV